LGGGYTNETECRRKGNKKLAKREKHVEPAQPQLIDAFEVAEKVQIGWFLVELVEFVGESGVNFLNISPQFCSSQLVVDLDWFE
jgi:hypothetical protein